MTLRHLLDDARIDPAVSALRPDYRVALILAEGLVGGSGDAASEALLAAAELSARDALLSTPVDELPHIAAWRDAYRAFGARPQRERNSAEALIRRAVSSGLPRINRLTDIYNAISVLHQIPVGGEDADRYEGAPRLIRADGSEPFDTVADCEPVVERPEPGEVVWADRAGVTCRRWNWRQGVRTRLDDGTVNGLFILDALGTVDDVSLARITAELAAHLGGTVTTRMLAAG